MRTRAYLALALRAGTDPPARGRHPLALAVEAATLLDVLTDAVAADVGGGPIHNRLALAWGLGPGGPGADLIRRILVLVADHELNASAFAARVAASTGASLSASALAGLATLSGPRHGGATAAVRTFAAEAAQLGPRAAIANRLVEDRALPGFGNMSTPRATRAPPPCWSASAARPSCRPCATPSRPSPALPPNVDFALMAASQALRLPPDAALRPLPGRPLRRLDRAR